MGKFFLGLGLGIALCATWFFLEPAFRFDPTNCNRATQDMKLKDKTTIVVGYNPDSNTLRFSGPDTDGGYFMVLNLQTEERAKKFKEDVYKLTDPDR